MYRYVLLIAVSFGLIACANNDKKISSWEVNDVYQSTMVTPDPATGQKIYIGPSINTMDDSNTYEMFNLRSETSKQGLRSYELQVHLTYYSQARNYDSASLLNRPESSFKVISREAGLCEARGCMNKELVSIKVTDSFLKDHLSNGFELTLSSKSGASTVVYIPAQYIKGYLKAVEGKSY